METTINQFQEPEIINNIASGCLFKLMEFMTSCDFYRALFRALKLPDRA